jgi:lipopolysaccharide transport system ATP-binding protein
MSDIVIKAENLGKKYLIGHQAEKSGYTALRDVLMQNARTLWNKTKDIAKGRPIIQGDTLEEVWALKDVSFEIRRGEAVGIIGRNGAGKSTLLKVLCRITEPTAGRVNIKGRVASLLEVGTGFHSELTGRENIYLNGTILGMTRAEIKRKFDEIVAFAEVEKYLDTPVKRYSSGMYVRLAFAVAAHLDPEILVVDEVLAVGDFAFQQKCLGKMEDVSRTGKRTVLFVSHNMGMIKQLCNTGILLSHGRLTVFGPVGSVIEDYLNSFKGAPEQDHYVLRGPLTGCLDINCILINGRSGSVNCRPEECINITVEGTARKNLQQCLCFISLYCNGVRLLTLQDVPEHSLMREGKFKISYKINPYFLRPGTYSIGMGANDGGQINWMWGTDLSWFRVIDEWHEGYFSWSEGNVNLYRVYGERTQ